MEKRLSDSTMIFKRAITPVLEITDPNGNKTVKIMNNECLIVGRSQHSDVSIEDEKLSRNHFMLVKADGKFQIKDLNSSNGMVVNGKRTKLAILTGNDIIKAGGTIFHFALSRTDLKKDEVLRQDIPLFNKNLFEKKYTPRKELIKKRILISSLSVSLIVFAITLGVMGWEKDAKVAPTVAQNKTLKSTMNIQLEIDSAKISEEDKVNAINYFRIAEHHFSLKNWDLAKKTMESYLRLIPDSKLGIAFIAVCDEASKKVEVVSDNIDEIQKEIEKRELIAKLVREGNYALNEGNLDEANSIFLRVISIDEYNQEAYDGLIAVTREFEKLKNKEEDNLIEIVPQGTVFAQQMEKAMTNKNYTKAYELAVTIATMGKDTAGDEHFTNAINTQLKIKSITNKMYANQMEKAGLFRKADATDEAIKIYKGIVSKFPYHDGAKAELGKIAKQRHEQAKELYASAMVDISYPHYSKANEKLRAILTLVPSNNEYHKKAKKLLSQNS